MRPFALYFFGFASLFANPEGLVVADGSAQIVSGGAPDCLLIETGRSAVIDWDSFSIAPSETVQFFQPDATSAVLNRVVGSETSHLMGQLLSNGAVYLVNPNGIVIGSEAHIATAGFIASTLDIVGDFTKEIVLQGESGESVVNQGTIRSLDGDIFLIARKVENEGSLVTHQGRQGLLSGHDILIRSEGAPEVRIRGDIEIQRELLDENLFALAIRHDGVIEAKEAYLVAEEGLCSIDGSIAVAVSDHGGIAHVLADVIFLDEHATIDASGVQGGGTILIGGDAHGDNPDIANANRTYVSPDARLLADALTEGNGGKVVVWSDESTQFYGFIGVRGGPSGGDGGFAEVSGQNLDFRGTGDASATLGKRGAFLLDPTNITISGTGAASGGSFNVAPPPFIWTSTGTTATIPATTDAASVQTLLGTGDVTINTSTNSGGPFGSAGTVAISSAISWSTSSSLTIIADSTLTVNAGANLTCTGGGSISLTSGNTTVTSNLTINGTTTISTSGGAGNLTFSSPSRIVLQSGTINITNSGTGTTTFNSSGNSSGTGGVSIGGATTIANSGGDITITATQGGSVASSSGALVINSTHAITNTGSGRVIINATTTASPSGTDNVRGVLVNGNFTSTVTTVNGDISITGTSLATGTTTNSYGIQQRCFNLTSTTGNITFTGVAATGSTGGNNNAGISWQGSLTFETGGTITLNATGGGGGVTTPSDGFLSGVTDTILLKGSATITGSTKATGATSSYGVALGGNFNTGASFPYSLTVNGTGTTGTGNGGVRVNGVIGSSTYSGTVSITGTSSGTGSSAYGIIVVSGASINTSNTVSLTGTGGASAFGISFGAGLTTRSGAMTFTGTSILAASVTFDTTNSGGSTGAAIQFVGSSSTIDGTSAGSQTLTFLAGTAGGAVTFGGVIGATTRVGAITITNALTTGTGVNIGGNITANSFTITSASAALLTATSTIDTSANNGAVSFGGAINASSSGSQNLTVTAGSGAITFSGAIGGTTRLGPISLTTSHATGVSIGSNVTTSSLTTTGSTKTVFTGSSTVDTSTGGAGTTVSFGGTVNGNSAGGQNVTFTAGVSDLVFSSTIGATTRLGNLSISGFVLSLAGNVTANSYTNVAPLSTILTGSVIIDTSAAGGNVSLTLINGTSAGAQNFTVTAGTGAVTLGTLGNGTRPGDVTVSGSGGVSLGGPVFYSITANSFAVTGSSPVTLTTADTAVPINTSTAGGNISFSSTINDNSAGGHTLTLNAGSGSITFSGAVGGTTRVGAITVTSSHATGVSVASNITANSFTAASTTKVALTGTSTFNTSTAGGVISFGGTVDGAQALTLTAGSGAITFSAAVGGTTPLTSLAATSSTLISLGGNITTAGGVITLSGPVTLGTTISLDATNGGGSAAGANITLGGTVNGAQALTLRAGTGGTIALSGVVGGTTPPTNITFTSSLLIQVAANITVSGANPLTFAQAVSLTGSSTVTSTNNTVAFSSTVNGTAAGSQSLTVTTGSGAITFSSTVGATTRLGAISLTTTNATGASIAANITANSLTLTGTSKVALTGGSTIDTSAANGVISFGGTINGSQSLVLTAGSGVITFSAAVGGSTPLASLAATSSTSISLGGNMTTAGGVITLSGPVTLGTTISLDSTNSGASAAGATITLGGTVNGAQALTLRAGSSGNITFSGVVGGSTPPTNITFTSSALIQVAANITVSGANPLTFAQAVSLTGSSTVTSNGSAITFSSTVNGANNLNVAAGASSTTFSGVVGGTTPLGALLVTATGGLSLGTGATGISASSVTVATSTTTTLNFVGTTTISTAASNGNATFGAITGAAAGLQGLTISVGSGAVNFNGNLGATRLGTTTINSTGSVSFSSATSSVVASGFSIVGAAASTLGVAGTTTFNTSAASGPIAFGGTINGTTANAQALTLNPGTGDITLSGAVGGTTALGAVTITNATNVTTAAITATSLTQSAGSGTSTFGGAVSLSSNLSLTGQAFTMQGAISAVNATYVNAGLLTFTSGAGQTLTGAFSQTGVGAVQTAGNIATSGGNISFLRGVTLTGNVNMETGDSTGDITFSSTINGAQGLTLFASNITFSSAVGGVTPLRSLSATTSSSTITVSADQTVTSGPMIYVGNVVVTTNVQFTNSGSGITSFTALTGDAIAGNFNVTISGLSSTVSVSGDIDLAGTSGSAGGALTINGGDGVIVTGQMLTQGGDQSPGSGGAGGHVSVSSSSGSVSVRNINTSGGDGTVAGGNAGNITLQPASGYSGGYPSGLIVLGQDLSSGVDGNLVALGGTSGGTNGTITLSANRSAAATVATITSSVAGNDVTIRGGSIVMGTYEAMTVLGNLSMTASTMTLGDLVAQRDLSLIASTITLILHGDVTILSNTGTFYTSPSLHFFAGSNYLQVGSLVPATGPIDAGSVAIAPSAFRSLLLYDSHILNYDTTLPIPPAQSSAADRQLSVYQLGIATAQLSDLVPIFDDIDMRNNKLKKTYCEERQNTYMWCGTRRVLKVSQSPPQSTLGADPWVYGSKSQMLVRAGSSIFWDPQWLSRQPTER
jgi:filamentous hemagglutinin family protein